MPHKLFHLSSHRRLAGWVFIIFLVSLPCILILVQAFLLDHGLIGTYYEYGDWTGPVRMTVRDTWIGTHRIPEHWENYSIRWQGVLYAPRTGKYEFMLLSDDGSTLSINDTLVVDNSGLHPLEEQSGTVQLKRGFHRISIDYQQGVSLAWLEVYWTPPNAPRSLLSARHLFPEVPADEVLKRDQIITAMLPVLTGGWLSFAALGLLVLLLKRRQIQPALSHLSMVDSMLLLVYAWQDTFCTFIAWIRKQGVSVLIYGLFLFVMTLMTFSYYQGTRDSLFTNPANILAGQSQAPNQYRVLVPMLYAGVNLIVEEPPQAVLVTEVLGITFCYLTTGLLFYKASRSLPLTMIAQLALSGAFIYGMLWRYRQEFPEVALIALLLLAAYSPKVNWWSVSLLTVLGTLNRETFIFGLIGVAAYALLSRNFDQGASFSRKLSLLALLFTLYFSIFLGLRLYYGVSSYHAEFWTYPLNIENLQQLLWHGNILYIGGGVLFIYLASLASGNTVYGHFILGYVPSFLIVSFLISMWDEQRIFYPMYPILLASVLQHSTDRVQRKRP